MQAGEALLERCIFVHLPRGADKLALLLAMVSKLLALASGACGEDNPDALPHHEVPVYCACALGLGSRCLRRRG